MLFSEGSDSDAIRLSSGKQLSTRVAVLQVIFRIPMAASLKDKRRVVKRLKTKLRKDYNVSVSEVGDQDVHRRGAIAVAVITGTGNSIDGLMENILEQFYRVP